MKLKNLLKTIAICLLLLLSSCALVSGSVSAQEAEYTITESELTLLDTRLEQLASSNIKLARDCRVLKAELAKSQTALNEAQAQTKKLQAELTALKQQSSSNELLLQTANESLELYEKEVKRQQRIIKTQRNIAWVLLSGALAVAIAT
jgi:chromosome segregation ATPase